MYKESWFEPHLNKLLRKNSDVLNNWRQQEPAGKHRTKNFENWLLVELVDQVYQSVKDPELRTNGFLPRDLEVKGFSKGSNKLSADITVHLEKRDYKVVAEIKTGLARKEILKDLAKVKRYSTRKDICNQAEFMWIVLLPDKKYGDAAIQSVEESFESIYKEIKEKKRGKFIIRKKRIQPWIHVVVAVAR